MAALVKITPSRLSVNPLVVRMVKVVPKEVEQSAAPAANACSGVTSRRRRSVKERPIGAPTPMAATRLERERFARRTLRFVERPPLHGCQYDGHAGLLGGHALTFIHDENQTQVA
jgi:hypothetical protein